MPQDLDIQFSFEFFPPKAETIPESFWAAVDELTALEPRFVSVTYGAGGTTRARTFEIVKAIQKRSGVSAAAHLTCVGSTREEIGEIVRDYWDAGIRHIVALRGDPPAGTGKYEPTPGGYPYSSHLIEGIKKIAPFEVSAAGYPEVHPDAESAQADIDALKMKQDAGADRIITQFFMENDDFLRWRDAAVKAGITIPIVPGILPIANFEKAASFAARCGAGMPAWVGEAFEGLQPGTEAFNDVSISLALRQCEILLAEAVRGFHFYTLNKAELSSAICKFLMARAGRKQAAASS